MKSYFDRVSRVSILLIVFGFLFTVLGLVTDKTKPFNPVLGYQITSFSTYDLAVTMIGIGIALFTAAWIVQEYFFTPPERELRCAFPTQFGIITFLHAESENVQDIKKLITDILAAHPEADLRTYEKEIHAKIIRIDRPKPKKNNDDDYMPIGDPD
jgi:hypothetical protein